MEARNSKDCIGTETSRAVHFREKGDESTQVTGADTPCPRPNGADRDAALGITELIYFHGTKKSRLMLQVVYRRSSGCDDGASGVHKTGSGERKTAGWTSGLDERRVKSARRLNRQLGARDFCGLSLVERERQGGIEGGDLLMVDAHSDEAIGACERGEASIVRGKAPAKRGSRRSKVQRQGPNREVDVRRRFVAVSSSLSSRRCPILISAVFGQINSHVAHAMSRSPLPIRVLLCSSVAH